MGTIVAFVLAVLCLVGFVVSMCVLVFLFWRKPKKETALPDGQYHIHFVGTNEKTGAPIYDVDEIKADEQQLGQIHETHQGM